MCRFVRESAEAAKQFIQQVERLLGCRDGLLYLAGRGDWVPAGM